MIPDQWYPILRSQDVRPNKPTGARRLGEDLVVWRDTAGRLVCQSARCPHKGANLADGRLRGDTLGCPYHDFRFGPDGECKAVPCLGSEARIPKSLRVATYPVRESNGLVWMWWGRRTDPLPEVQVPSEVADNPLLHATATWTQPVHYTRYIESLLDFYHVPIVHRDHWFNAFDYVGGSGTPRKLGLDGKQRYFAMTKVENSTLEVEGTTIRNTFDLCAENDPTNRQHLNVTFTFPCMVHIDAEPFDITVWMTPVDDGHTQVFYRWWEDPHLMFLRSPRLRRVLPRLALFAQKRVQEVQDMKVVSQVRPRVSERGMNKFVAADELNARYLVMRDRLKREAGVLPAEPAAEPAAERPENGGPAENGGAPGVDGGPAVNGGPAANGGPGANGRGGRAEPGAVPVGERVAVAD